MTLVGQQCPQVGGLQVLKGESVQVPTPGHVTVVEVWATWCPPCRAVFPHLSQIYNKHKGDGLKVVGVTQEPFTPTLAQFVGMQGNNMSYNVAVDGAGDVQKKLMQPGGARGIPTAFIVDKDGVIQYQGHPADPNFEHTIERLLQQPAKSQEPKKEDAPTIEPLEHDEEVLKSASVKQLKQEMQRLGLSTQGLLEKHEFVKAIMDNKK
eukprot:m.134990 g.134990  ORF g.134990 m.134990 type:complete len:208 (+) comp9796_c0_seq1:495-1118(+)